MRRIGAARSAVSPGISGGFGSTPGAILFVSPNFTDFVHRLG